MPLPDEPDITLSEQDGVRYLHFGTEWVQGAMRLDEPDVIEIEYVRQMMAWLLFLRSAQTVL
ncbi:MAG: spermidine synthase, partial [Betaproteobacteria bacterium]